MEKGCFSDFVGLRIQSSRKQGKKIVIGRKDKIELKLDFIIISSLKRKD